ncbi:MAG: hypothetical protein KTR31_34950 [Myxococcales bacterium]|nr:hypothetical protein [Myxococcales bacterium]
MVVLQMIYTDRNQQISTVFDPLIERPEQDPIYPLLQAKAEVYLVVRVGLDGMRDLKYASPDPSRPGWKATFDAFLEDVPTLMAASYEDLKRPLRDVLGGRRLAGQRIVGEDVLYFVGVDTFREVLGHVQALVDATTAFNERLHRQRPCRAAAWLCGVPISDVKRQTKDGSVAFVGPSMDLGDALFGRARPFRITVSTQVATMLCDSMTGEGRLPHSLQCYVGEQPVDGLCRGFEWHPLIWVGPPALPRHRPLCGVAPREEIREPGHLGHELEELRHINNDRRWFLKADSDDRYRGPTQYWLRLFREEVGARSVAQGSGSTPNLSVL